MISHSSLLILCLVFIIPFCLNFNFLSNDSKLNPVYTIKGENNIEKVSYLGNNLIAYICLSETINIKDISTTNIKMSFSTKDSTDLVNLGNDLIATSSKDKTISIWNTSSGQKVNTLLGHKGQVKALAIIDSNQLASGASDSNIIIWNVSSGVIIKVINTQIPIDLISYLGNDLIAVASKSNILLNKSIYIYNIKSGQLVKTIKNKSYIKKLSYIGKNQLAIIDNNNVFSIVDIRSGEKKKLIKDSVSSMTYMGNDQLLYSTALNSGRSINIINTITGSITKSFKLNDNETMYELTIIDENRFLSLSKLLFLWDFNKEERIDSINNQPSVWSMTYLGNDLLATRQHDDKIFVINYKNGQIIRRIDEIISFNDKIILNMVYLENDLLATFRTNSILIWNFQTGEKVKTIEIDSPLDLIYLGNNKLAVAGRSKVSIVDFTSGKIEKEIKIEPKDEINSLLYLQNDNLLINTNNNSYIYKISSGTKIKTLNIDTVLSSLDLGNGILILSLKKGVVLLYDISTGKIIKSVELKSIKSFIKINNNEVVSLERLSHILLMDSSTLEVKERLILSNLDIFPDLISVGNNQIATGSYFYGDVIIIESN